MIHITKSDIPDIYHVRVQTLLIGTYLTYEGKVYEITSTTTHQDRDGQITTMATLLAVDADGEDIGEAPITLNLDEADIELI